MAVLRRYTNQHLIQDKYKREFSYRYKRPIKDLSYNQVTLDRDCSLDYLSVKYYQTPLLYWAIADINDIEDPLITIPKGTIIKIPLI